MKLIVAFVFFLCEAEAFNNQNHLNPAMKKEIINPRIAYGKNARANQFPFMVGLEPINSQGTTFNCGGALLSNTWVITSGHCLYGRRSTTVYLGDINKHKSRDQFIVGSDNMIIHYDYDDVHLHADIGLIRIPYRRYLPSVGAVSLPYSNPSIGSRAIAPGWGQIYTNGPLSDTLKYAEGVVIRNSVCASFYPDIDDNIICTNSTHGGICGGDSGGPLVLLNSNVLIGITSFSYPRGCLSGPPDGFTRITSYLHWIHNITGIGN